MSHWLDTFADNDMPPCKPCNLWILRCIDSCQGETVNLFLIKPHAGILDFQSRNIGLVQKIVYVYIRIGFLKIF